MRLLRKKDISSSLMVKRATFAQARDLKSEIIICRGSLFDGDWLRLLNEKSVSRHFVITDTIVGSLYGDRLVNFLDNRGIDIDMLTIPVGEGSKSMGTYEELSSHILKNGVDKDSYIIGFGGGVVNNIAGFLASTIYRGVGLIQIPTSLLAQVDAAIDFKQAINGLDGKNHIGSYYPADVIVIDPNLLQTLPERHLKNGLAESIKHALTQDRTFYEYFLLRKGNFGNEIFIDEVIARTVSLKIILLTDVLSPEYSEMLMQYGHAVGHALEQVSQYKIFHGEAIAIGMCVTAEIAQLLNICDEETTIQHYDIMSQYGLPVTVPSSIADVDLLSALRHDKHFLNGNIKLALVSHIGRSSVYDIGQCTCCINSNIVNAALKKNRERRFNNKK